MSALALVRAGGGARRTRGLDRSEVARLLRSGDLVRPARGVVALPDADARLVAAASLDAVVSCASAADLHGVPLLDRPRRLHLTVPRGANGRRLPSGVVLHRRDVPGLDGVTTLARTAADCLRCLPELAALAVVDGVLARGVPRAEVADQLGGRGAAEPRRLLALADGRAQAPGETVARLATARAGLPVQPQVMIAGIGWVDLLVDGWIVVEIDGRTYHSDEAAFANDRWRDAELTIGGYAVLRFPHALVVRHPEHVVATVRRLVARGRAV
jgi:very-short-patch-repair endonuclease